MVEVKVKVDRHSRVVCVCGATSARITDGQTILPCPMCGRVYKGVYNAQDEVLEAVVVSDPTVKEHIKPLANKIGKVRVSHELIQERLEKDTPEIQQLFSKLIIVKAESNFMRNEIEYYAYSDMFRDVPMGEEAPEYMIKVTRNEDETITITAEEKRGL